MGAAHNRARGALAQRQKAAAEYLAGREQQLAQNRRTASEENLKIQESLLGTESQVAGYDITEELLPYTGRYTFDPTAGALQNRAGSAKTIGVDTLRARTDRANDLMQQAEDAARSGDFTSANGLRQLAQTSLTQIDPGKRKEGDAFRNLGGMEGIGSIFEFKIDPDLQAKASLNSPLAKMLGRQVQEAAAFSDFNSPESIRERQLVTDPADRVIAAQQRDALRRSRNERLAQGVGRSLYAERATDQRTVRDFAAQRTQLYADVAKQFNEWRRTYGQNVASFARDYIQNTGGIRETYQASMDQIAANVSNLSAQFAENYQQDMQYFFQRQDANQARSDARRAEYIGLISSIISSYPSVKNMLFGGKNGGGDGGGVGAAIAGATSGVGEGVGGAAGSAAPTAVEGAGAAAGAIGEGASAAVQTVASFFA